MPVQNRGLTKHGEAGLAFLTASSILRALAFQGDVTISAPNGGDVNIQV